VQALSLSLLDRASPSEVSCAFLLLDCGQHLAHSKTLLLEEVIAGDVLLGYLFLSVLKSIFDSQYALLVPEFWHAERQRGRKYP
jgi:hypothetical protein